MTERLVYVLSYTNALLLPYRSLRSRLRTGPPRYRTGDRDGDDPVAEREQTVGLGGFVTVR